MRFHRSLKGIGAPPSEWVISKICEEFSCLPSQAVRELDREPELIAEVLMLRSYARTKEQVDAAKSESDLPKGPMAELVADIEFELEQARRARYADDGE